MPTRKITETKVFRRDAKRMDRRGKDLSLLFDVVNRLVEGIPLEPKHKDHALVGNWKPSRDCHIQPDWILIYEVTDEEVFLIRTGTHADLFKK